MSTGNLYAGLTWSRSTTTLTVTSPSHGLTTGNYVVLRNMNVDYVYVSITSTGTDTFTCTVADSGATSGTAGAYIPAVGLTSITEAAATVTTPSAGNVQVNSISVTTSDAQTSGIYVLTMPSSISNGGGANTSISNQNPPLVGVWDLSTGGYIGAASNVAINTSSNFNIFTVGSINTFVNSLIRFQF